MLQTMWVPMRPTIYLRVLALASAFLFSACLDADADDAPIQASINGLSG